MDKQGFIKDIAGNRMLPQSVTTLINDVARNQALSASLTALVEKNALGFPTFSTVTPYGEGETVYYDRRLWTFTADHAAGAWTGEDVEEANVKDIIITLITDALESGEVVPALADNLASWDEDFSEVTNQWDETIRSTAGDDAIRTDNGGVLKSIVATGEDFKCTALRATAYNQLRLVSNGGGASSIGSDASRVIPVPHLQLGQFGDASFNNGMLFTKAPTGYSGGFVFGGADVQPTVRFVPLASGQPTSTTAGTVVTPTTVTYDDKTYHTYLTSGEGWLIVTPPSGTTWAELCAHLAWEDWYDRFVSPTDAADTGDSIALSALFSAAPNGTGKFLVLGNLATRADRTSATQMKITDPIARVASPSWTNTEDEENPGTYTHTLDIGSTMKDGGAAAIEGSQQVLTVSGTTVSYTDTNATAISGAVRYERATEATATVTLSKTAYDLDDCGCEIKEGAVGTAFFECSYAQNVADALSQIAKYRVGDIDERLDGLDEYVVSRDDSDPAQEVDLTAPLMLYGQPMKLYAAGTPAEALVPDNWTQLADGGFNWNGLPIALGQEYIDTANGGKYEAVWNNYATRTLKWLKV